MPEEDEEGTEKRKFKRIDQHFMARFRRPGGNWQTIFLRDLGAGGVLFNHGSALEPGCPIEISITFPVSRAPIQCSATVVRVRSFSLPMKIYEIAACFTDIDEAQQALIREAAETYFSKKKGRSE